MAKSFYKEKQKKIERNLQKNKEKELMRQQRFEQLVELKKKLQLEKIRRENLKKAKQKEMLAEKQDFVKQLRKVEKEWEEEVEQFVCSKVHEKRVKRDLVKLEENKNKRKRCISQMTNRKVIKENYDEKVDLLKLQHNEILLSLSTLNNQHELLNKHVEQVLEKRDKTIKSLENP